MDYVNPSELLSEALRAARRNAQLGVGDMLLRGALAGAFLGFATSLVFMIQTQGVPPIVGALLFPVGFVMLVLLGLELATGNFALLPPAVAAGEITLGQLLRNWFWVYLGNLIGSACYALLFYLAVTNCGQNNGGPAGDLLRAAAQKETLGYMASGGRRLEHCVYQSRALQLDGYRGNAAGHGVALHDRQDCRHVAPHSDVLRPRL